MTSFSFHKEERLCSQKIIDTMFASGNSFLCYPLKVVWIETRYLPAGGLEKESPYHAQFAFTVPKKNFKRAVKRNLLKRRMRESYRLRKETLYNHLEDNNKKIAAMVIFIAKEPLEYNKIDKAMAKALEKLISVTTDH
jgi:ribonuclease P protein component